MLYTIPYRYEFIVKDEDDNTVFRANKPTIEMLEEEIGRWENHKEKFISEYEAKNN